MAFAAKFRRWLARHSAPRAVAAQSVANDAAPTVETREGKRWRISPAAIAELAASPARDTWQMPQAPHWLKGPGTPSSGLAMDSVPMAEMASWAMDASPFTEGLGFLGYGYLAELTQRSEYRRISEIWAAECTRKWIKLKGDNPERIAKLEEAMTHFGVREKFREAAEIDGFMGRSHIYLDFGDAEGLENPLAHTPETIPVDSLKNLKVVEAYWVYPLRFNTTNPLADDFYAPTQWQVMGQSVHNSRILTFVGRELPDMLKPVYMFGGLSLSQMAKPYVDSFIRNRTSVGNLLYSFSTMVLATNMSSMLAPDGAGELMRRIQAYTFGRDNSGLMLVDKETEELTNVSAPLGTVDKLLAQSQEQISSVVGIPLVVLLGVTPTGLNASSEGELKAFYAHIRGYQEKTFQAPLNTILRVLQLNLDGEVDEGLTFEFVDLWELDEEAKARVRQTQAQVDGEYLDRGVLDGEEVRERLKAEEGGPYFGVDLVGGEPTAEPGEGEEPDDEGDDGPHPGGIENLRQAAQDALSTLVANDALPAALAQDAGEGEHWITVHPNGKEEKGQPLLIRGSPSTGYTVVGGAGGKLNGQVVKPGSMSGPRGGGGSPAPEVDHKVRKDGESSTEYANRMSQHANIMGGHEAHYHAAGAHKAAETELRASAAEKGGQYGEYGAGRADYLQALEHQKLHGEHTRAGHQARLGEHWRSKVAHELSEAAANAPQKPKTKEEWFERGRAHSEAAQAHSDAYQEGTLADVDRDAHQGHYASYREHLNEEAKARTGYERAVKREKTELKREKAKEALGADGLDRIAEIESRHLKGTREELDKHFRERWGLGIFGATNAIRDLNKLRRDRDWIQRYNSRDPEVKQAARAEYEAALEKARGQHGHVRGHTDVDIDDGGQAAKAQRRMIGHLEAALEHLESQGYDIAGALRKAQVEYAPGGTGKSLGHAFQKGAKGYFSLSGGKSGLEHMQSEIEAAARRREAGKPAWTAGANGSMQHFFQSTIIHELTHALGMQSHINSPDRLHRILQKAHPEYGARKSWIAKNISEYGASNIHETDAELATMVTHPDYVPGTLPEELENHVRRLFNHKDYRDA